MIKYSLIYRSNTLFLNQMFLFDYSHAINAYLVTKYAKDDQLYPKDVKAKSVVDHRLHFDNGVLFQVPKFVIVSVKY